MPGDEIVHIPLASIDVPFVFNEVTADFQDATIQGELTYRITDPKRLAGVLDFSVDARGDHRSDDPSKLNDRLIHAAQTLARTYTQRCKLRDLLVASAELIATISAGLQKAPEVTMLGVEILGLSIMSIKANPEMAKALQAAAREELLRRPTKRFMPDATPRSNKSVAHPRKRIDDRDCRGAEKTPGA